MIIRVKFSFFKGLCLTYTSLSSLSGSIRSPGWPFQYSNEVAKCWRISAPRSNYVVTFTINSLNLQYCAGCSCDSVEFFDGYGVSSTSLGKFCTGNVRVVSSGQHLYVKFTSDSSQRGNSFTATYTAQLKGKSRVDCFNFSGEELLVYAQQWGLKQCKQLYTLVNVPARWFSSVVLETKGFTSYISYYGYSFVYATNT